MTHPTRIFKTPEELSMAWDAYKEWLSDEAKNWPKIQYVGKDGDRKVDFPPMPYTLEGFKRYCRKHYGEVHQYFINKDELYGDFVPICTQVREEIRDNQITGGLLGFYNPSITQRLNGLTEKTENKNENTDVVKITMNLNGNEPDKS